MVLFCLFYWSEKGTILEKTGTIWHLAPLEVAQDFIDMFLRIQVESFSEAVCDTIGSIMSTANKKGRNCYPVNFSEEVSLCHNLPPMHILARSFVTECD